MPVLPPPPRLDLSADRALRCAIVPVTRFAQNCSVVWCARTRRGAVIDPGGDLERILRVVRAEDIAVERILLTHGHLDHAGGALELSETLEAPLAGPHRAEAPLLRRLAEQGDLYDLDDARSITESDWLDDGDTVRIGEQTLEVLHVPGHTAGHVGYFHRGDRQAFVGDVLFRGSVGRTEGSAQHITLIRSIVTRLWPLGRDVGFVPGHGALSTFGAERGSNPYLADHLLAPHLAKILATAPDAAE
jgi:glyoxylase-like metal-dependent hydrolase (beta-lactamase superfamily II)